MDSTISVSKGCFVFKNGATRADKSAKKTKRKRLSGISKIPNSSNGILGSEFIEQPFYKTYADLWSTFEADIENLQHQSYARTLNDLVEFVVAQGENDIQENYGMSDILPAAALLTGINQPDHLNQFETLSQRINEKIAASICVLQSRDCPSIKAAIESMVYNFVEAPHEDAEDRDHKRLRRSQCNMKQLKHWYLNNFGAATKVNVEQTQKHLLLVILPDFECFGAQILQDFILILSAHCAEMPFMLILGVATSVSAVHNSLPYHVTSKVKLKVFQTQPSPTSLNEVEL